MSVLAVKHRENMRFARAKLWGIIRSLFRAVGLNLKKLGLTDDKEVRIKKLSDT